MSALRLMWMRGVGEAEFASGLSTSTQLVFWILTHLGNPYGLLAVVLLLYVSGPKLGVTPQYALCVLACGLIAVGVTIGLKHYFLLARPPTSYRGGYGFPSGHAFGATVFWGAIGILSARQGRRARVAGAICVILTVAASRVILGVHYIIDVIVGMTLGASVLLVAVTLPTLARRHGASSPTRVSLNVLFAVAILSNSTATLFAPGRSELYITLGIALAVSAALCRQDRSFIPGFRSHAFPPLTVAIIILAASGGLVMTLYQAQLNGLMLTLCGSGLTGGWLWFATIVRT